MFALEIPFTDNHAERLLTLFELERFTNDGSPSGHTFLKSSSTPTTAWHGLPDFPLPILRGIQRREYGDSSSLASIGLESGTECPVHPDCIHLTGHQMLPNNEYWRQLRVAPTSSPRVVVALPERRFALKLHYPRILGRFDRPLLGEQLQFGVDVSQHFVAQDFVNSEFFPEIYTAEYSISMFGANASEQSYGFLIRDLQPISLSEIEWAVPAFSILAQRNLGLLRRPLLEDIVKWVGVKTKLGFICDCFLPTLCDSISELVVVAGVWPEITAQNFYFSKTKNGLFKIIWRDFQGCFVDLELLNTSGYCGPLINYSYHSIAPGGIQWRSYLFDDVFGHHLISPILRIFSHQSDRIAIIKVLQERIKNSGLVDLLPVNAYAMKKRAPRKNERLELYSLPKPIWRP